VIKACTRGILIAGQKIAETVAVWPGFTGVKWPRRPERKVGLEDVAGLTCFLHRIRPYEREFS
jgi:hypothetical protein